jgi:tetratricopeptide (TPR) repeat protein
MAAYEDYLLARQSNFREAERLLESALQKDSTFALAWASLALIYSKSPSTDSFDRQYYVKKSLNAALTAVNYGPELAEPHMILGDILKTITLNPNLSIKELNKSITINPNNAEGYLYLAFALMELGRFPESEANLKKASQLDPKSFLIMPAWNLYYYYSRDAKGMEKLIRTQNIPDTGLRRLGRKVTYYFLIDQYDSMLLDGNGLRPMPYMGIALIKTGKTATVNKIIDSLKREVAGDNWFDIAILYAWMGEKQKAMDYLKVAYKLNDYGLISIRVNKLFDPLRNEDSFKKLMARMEII